MNDSVTNKPNMLLPRNLTARAAHVVRGNPVNTRPESGVDNSHPGLEFDQRMMSRAFFPGLVFDFQYGVGAKLADIRPDLFTYPFDLKAEDLPAESEDASKALWLWYIGGKFGGNPDKHAMKDLYGQNGYDVVRAITDLEDDTIIVVFGKQPEHLDKPSAKVFLKRFLNPARLIAAFKDHIFGASDGFEIGGIFRSDDGEVQLAVMVGPRAKYLNEEGVIDPALIQPGELTQSLCSPWQWDFADCGCYYWAGSKPDIVKPPLDDAYKDPLAAPSLRDQTLNFQRKRSEPVPDKPGTTPDEWHENQMGQPDMVQHWETLPFVVDERETDVYKPHPLPPIQEPWDRNKIREELAVLATAEHSLCVEYLYASYSIKAMPIPPERRYAQTAIDHHHPDLQGDRASRLFAASHEVFMVAVDEMRHLRWANEAIMLLGGEPTLDRATIMGRRPTQAQLKFKLAPLTGQQLDDFISVEKFSPFYNLPDPTSLDGIYTHIQISIMNRPQDYPEPGMQEKLLQLIKLIIDEGVGHYERFSLVKEKLAGLREDEYLAVKTEPVRASEEFYADLQDLADTYYDALLRGLCLTFHQGNASRGVMLEQARRSMYSLHDTAYRLQAAGYGVPFTLPSWVQAIGDTDTPRPCNPTGKALEAQDVAAPAKAKLAEIAAKTNDDDTKAMVKKHESVLDEMVAGIRRLID